MQFRWGGLPSPVTQLVVYVTGEIIVWLRLRVAARRGMSVSTMVLTGRVSEVEVGIVRDRRDMTKQLLKPLLSYTHADFKIIRR